jgi:hypothetical protein
MKIIFGFEIYDAAMLTGTADCLAQALAHGIFWETFKATF